MINLADSAQLVDLSTILMHNINLKLFTIELHERGNPMATDERRKEIMFYGRVGHLYPYDFRYDPTDRAFCSLQKDGRLHIRLQVEPSFTEANLIVNDGSVRHYEMTCWGKTGRYAYYEVKFKPKSSQITYGFACRQGDEGHILYIGSAGLTHVIELPFQLNVENLRPFDTPDWARGAVMYQIFPERFANGDPSNDPPNVALWGSEPAGQQFQGGDLNGITQNLDYIQALGVDILYLNPINASPSNHKYDASDFMHVDPAFGGDKALHELVDAVHARGMKIIIDASFNHCHPSFFAFQDLLKNGVNSRYKDWFTVYDYPIEVRYRPHLFPDSGWSFSPEELHQYVQAYHEQTGIPTTAVSDNNGPMFEATFNAWYGVITMPQLNQANPETRQYFLKVAQHWQQEFKLDGWRMDVVQFVEFDFWSDFRTAVRQVNPNAYLLSEIWGNSSNWLQGDKFDGTMNYIFRQLCLDFFADESSTSQQLAEGIVEMLGMYGEEVTAVNQNLLSSHDVPRFLTKSNNISSFLLATLFQLTLPGIPSIYYGDEVGLTGGEDPQNRRAFPWHETASWNQSILGAIKELTHLRHKHKALQYGTWELQEAQQNLIAYTRKYQNETIAIVINRASNPNHVLLPDAPLEPKILWGNATLALNDSSTLKLKLSSRAGCIIELS